MIRHEIFNRTIPRYGIYQDANLYISGDIKIPYCPYRSESILAASDERLKANKRFDAWCKRAGVPNPHLEEVA